MLSSLRPSCVAAFQALASSNERPAQVLQGAPAIGMQSTTPPRLTTFKVWPLTVAPTEEPRAGHPDFASPPVPEKSKVTINSENSPMVTATAVGCRSAKAVVLSFPHPASSIETIACVTSNRAVVCLLCLFHKAGLGTLEHEEVLSSGLIASRMCGNAIYVNRRVGKLCAIVRILRGAVPVLFEAFLTDDEQPTWPVPAGARAWAPKESPGTSPGHRTFLSPSSRPRLWNQAVQRPSGVGWLGTRALEVGGPDR